MPSLEDLGFMTTFIWVGGQDQNGANNWITPGNWTVGGAAATIFPDLGNGAAPIDVIDNIDSGLNVTIISNSQTITISSLSLGNSGVAGVAGAHLLVGGGNAAAPLTAIGGDGNGTLNVTGAITITSTNSQGALVGGKNGTVNAGSMTIGDPSGVFNPNIAVGGGGTFNIAGAFINDGDILADGGFFDLGPVVLNAQTITGTGFLEVSGNSTLEINAATAQKVQAIFPSPGEVASVVFDQPTAFTGSLSLFSGTNSTLDLFFKNETPTTATVNAANQLVITGAGGAVLNTISFTSTAAVPVSVVTSTKAGYGEVVLGVATSTPTPTPTPASHDQFVVINNTGTLHVEDKVSGQDVTATQSNGRLITFSDGTGVFDPSGAAENVARLYQGVLHRAPDVAGLLAWTNDIDDSHVPLSAVANSFATSPEFIQTYGALSDDGFVQKLYLNALGRPADAAGEHGWDDALASGLSRGAVAQAFAESPENRVNTVSTAGDRNDAEAFRLYQAALARTPDQAGQLAWSAVLANGATPSQVAQGFVSSAEFQQKYGALDNSHFVAQLYLNALNRPEDAAGAQAWVSALQQGMSRADVVVGFSDSLENRMQTAGATHDGWVFIPS
jgi:hypothetical protein